MPGRGRGLCARTTPGTSRPRPSSSFLPLSHDVARKVPGQAHATHRLFQCNSAITEISAEGCCLSHPGLGDSWCYSHQLPQGCHDQATHLSGLHRSPITFVSQMQAMGTREHSPGCQAQAAEPRDSLIIPGPLSVDRALPGTVASVSHSRTPPLCSKPFASFLCRSE